MRYIIETTQHQFDSYSLESTIKNMIWENKSSVFANEPFICNSDL